MRRGISTSVLPIIALAALSGCTAPASPQDADAGPAFAEMPVDGLVGATPQVLSAAFGRPAILRVDGTAQVWLYHDAGCGLNLVLYPDGAGTPRVAMASPTDDGGDAAACSAALERDHVAGLTRPVAQTQVALPEPVSEPVAEPVAPSPPAIAQPNMADPSLDGPGIDNPGAALERPSSS